MGRRLYVADLINYLQSLLMVLIVIELLNSIYYWLFTPTPARIMEYATMPKLEDKKEEMPPEMEILEKMDLNGLAKSLISDIGKLNDNVEDNDEEVD